MRLKKTLIKLKTEAVAAIPNHGYDAKRRMDVIELEKEKKELLNLNCINNTNSCFWNTFNS